MKIIHLNFLSPCATFKRSFRHARSSQPNLIALALPVSITSVPIIYLWKDEQAIDPGLR